MLFKVREIIIKKKNENTKINGFALVPLYERLKTKDCEESNLEKIPYQITGVQLILKSRDVEKSYRTAFINFRSLLDENRFQVKPHRDDINYVNRLTFSKTKMIEQHNIQGVYVETQFKNVIADDLNSDFICTGIYNDDEIYSTLRETNMVAMNSCPIDFLGLMELPEINDDWFQRYRKEYTLDDSSDKINLELEKALHRNYKRYFSCWEILKGEAMINQVGLNINHENRDQYKIIHVFKRLNA